MQSVHSSLCGWGIQKGIHCGAFLQRHSKQSGIPSDISSASILASSSFVAGEGEGGTGFSPDPDPVGASVGAGPPSQDLILHMPFLHIIFN